MMAQMLSHSRAQRRAFSLRITPLTQLRLARLVVTACLACRRCPMRAGCSEPTTTAEWGVLGTVTGVQGWWRQAYGARIKACSLRITPPTQLRLARLVATACLACRRCPMRAGYSEPT